MGIAYHVDTEQRLSVAVVHGNLTAAEFHEMARRQDADAAWHTTTRSLTDARGAVTAAVTAEELAAFASLYADMRRHDPPFSAAIVAGADFALAGSYGKLRTVGRTRTIAFTAISTACTWLGVESDGVNATIAELHRELREGVSPS